MIINAVAIELISVLIIVENKLTYYFYNDDLYFLYKIVQIMI